MTWQVEQAHEPPQAPEIFDSVQGRMKLGRKGLTFHIEIIGLGNVQEVVAGTDLKCMFGSVFVDKGHMQPVLVFQQYAAESSAKKHDLTLHPVSEL